MKTGIICEESRLICGDCLDVLPTLEAGSVDAVVTDPPYGIGLGINKDKRRGTGRLWKVAYLNNQDTYEEFVDKVVPRLNAALDKVERAAVFTGPHIWEQRKANAIGGIYHTSATGRNQWGFKNFLPVLFYGRHPALNRGCYPTVLKSTANVRKNGHPCPKPLEWMRWLIELVTLPGETVLDPFAGSGTTGVACLQTGRRFIGIELNKDYCAIAQKRIEAARAAKGGA